MAPRVAGTLAFALILVCVGSGPASSQASRATKESVATLNPFALIPPHGIALWIHPTAARIVLSVTANGRLKACEVGTTFSRYWRGGCRQLINGRLTLPTSGGAAHIGFRVVPLSDRGVQVQRLHVQWHCVDHFFLLQRDVTKARLRGSPVFDC